MNPARRAWNALAKIYRSARPLTATLVLFGTTPALAAEATSESFEEASYFRVSVHKATDFTAKDLAKLARIASLMERILNSPEFHDGVRTFKSPQKVGGRITLVETFVQNEGLSNAEILGKMMDGVEDFYKESAKDNPRELNRTADFYLDLYTTRKSSKVIGKTLKGRRLIQLNQRYFRNYSEGFLAGNLVHEWLHKLGFSHDYNATTRRPFSVPYAIGNLVRDLAKKLPAQPTVEASRALASEESESLEDPVEFTEPGEDLKE